MVKSLICLIKKGIKQILSNLIYYFILISNKRRLPDKVDFDFAVICMASLGDFITFCSVAKELYKNNKSIVLICRANTGIDEFAHLTGYFKNVVPISTKFKHRITNINMLKEIKAQNVIVAPAERHILSDIYALSVSSNFCILPDTVQACSSIPLKKLVDNRIEKLIFVDAVYELERYEQYLQNEFNMKSRLSIFQFDKEKSDILNDKKEYITVFPAAGGGRIKEWHIERFAHVLNKICEQKNYIVYICGTKAETEKCEKLFSMLSVRAKNICGQTNLQQLKEILEKSAFTLANDSGSAHFSIACKTPTAVICGCWEYGRFYPNNRMSENSVCIIADKNSRSCIPCGKSKPECDKNTAHCITDIGEEVVLNFIKKIF